LVGSGGEGRDNGRVATATGWFACCGTFEGGVDTRASGLFLESSTLLASGVACELCSSPSSSEDVSTTVSTRFGRAEEAFVECEEMEDFAGIDLVSNTFLLVAVSLNTCFCRAEEAFAECLETEDFAGFDLVCNTFLLVAVSSNHLSQLRAAQATQELLL
jgi:hypothetical protein